METAARDRFKATRPALIETRQEALARPWGNGDARAPPLELSRGVSPRDPASNPTPRCVPPKTRNEGSDKNFSTKLHGSAVRRSQTAHRLTNNGTSAGPMKRRPLTGAGLLPGVTTVSWEQAVVTAGTASWLR